MEILVLSKTNEPIVLVPWRRAVRLLSAGKLEMVGAATIGKTVDRDRPRVDSRPIAIG